MSGLAGQTSLFPPEPAPDPLLCWLWLAHVLGPASVHAGRVLDAFGGAQEAWEARDTAEFRLAAGEAAALRAQQLAPEQYHPLVMRCDACGGTIKPDVVLYEEGLDQQTLEDAVFYISHADMLIVGGTSLAVYPAAGLIDYYRGNKLVLINKSATPMDARADLLIQDGLGNVFSQIKC